MRRLEPKYHAKIMALPTNSKEHFALIHLGINEGENQFASFLGIATEQTDDDGSYYVVLAEHEISDEEPVVLMAFHRDVVEASTVPYEIFKANLDGKFDKN